MNGDRIVDTKVVTPQGSSIGDDSSFCVSNAVTPMHTEHALIAARKKEGELLTTEDLRGMTYTWQVVQETMRHTPILAVGFRQATKDFVYNGYTIRKGWKVSNLFLI